MFWFSVFNCRSGVFEITNTALAGGAFTVASFSLSNQILFLGGTFCFCFVIDVELPGFDFNIDVISFS